MMRAPRSLLGSLTFAGALASTLGLTACWVVVGGEDKVLVEEDEGRGGRTGKAGAGGLGSGEAGTAGTAGGTAGQAAIGGAGGVEAGGSAGANGGAPATGGASGAGTSGGGQGGAAIGGAGSGGTGGTGGTGVSGSAGAAGSASGGGGSSGTGGTGASGSAGMGGSASGAGGTAGKSGAAGVGGAAGAAGATGGVQTGPGQFDCNAQPFKSSYPFCTNFSPAPGGWEEFTGCNTRPMSGGNTTFLWTAAKNSKCSAYLDAGVPLSPKQVSLSLWARAKEIAVADGEPVVNFTTLTVGPGLDASIGVRQTRNGLGVITGNILVVTSTSLPAGTLDVGPFPLDTWHHVTVTLGFKDAKLVVGGGYGLTSADELAKPSVETSKAGSASGTVDLRLSFIQTIFLAGPTSVEVDDLYVH